MKDPIIAAQVSLEKVKGDIVQGTLDAVNAKDHKKSRSCSNDAVNESYQFNKSVLSAAYEAKGVVINDKG